jgi:alkylation response protein AidB-like acyl-CoA dehydrogenase
MDRFELRYADYSLSSDQEAVRDAFGEFFRNECPTERVRAAEPFGYDEKLWRQLADMGAASMGLAESAGGGGASLVDLLLVAKEAGAALAPVPYVEHAVASRALAGSPGATAELVAEVASGRRVAALAMEPVGASAAGASGGGASVRQLVPGGAVARSVLALDGSTLVVVHADEPRPLAPNQGSTPLAWWDLGDGRRQELASGPDAVARYQVARAEWKLLTAAALVGLTERALGIAVEFARTRETMGVPIGSLQGVAFPLADVAIGISGARNLVWRAGWMLEHEPSEARRLVPAAFAYAAQVATHGATTSAHMQGGLGFTSEADASLYFLRAKGWSLLAGDPAEDVIAVADALVADRLAAGAHGADTLAAAGG